MTEGWATSGPKLCDVCGAVSRDVAPGMAKDRDAGYYSLDRCKDHAACAERVRAASREGVSA